MDSLLNLEKSILEFLNSIKEGQKNILIFQQMAEIIDFDQMLCNLQQHFLKPQSESRSEVIHEYFSFIVSCQENLIEDSNLKDKLDKWIQTSGK